MFIKKINKKNNENKTYTYYRLCESVRIGNSIRHHNLLNLGSLEGLNKEELKSLANAIESAFLGQTSLFNTNNSKIESLANQFSTILKEKRKIDNNKNVKRDENTIYEKKDFEKIDINSIEHESAREIGAEWLCLQALDELKLASFFAGLGWDIDKINNAFTLIISRAVNPVSEYKTAQWIEHNSAITELIFKEHKKFSHQQLYKIGDELYKCKDKLCDYLSNKTNELFNITDKIIFYDLTNTYFEGRKVGSELAQYGRSKEKRSDAKLVSLALVVNTDGFVKQSKIYSGNIYEAHTLMNVIEELNENKKGVKPLIVMDAGISIEDNLLLLKKNGYDYLCVTRSKLKDFTMTDTENSSQEITDRKDNKITLKHITKPNCTDQFMYIKSEQKSVKEVSMESNYCKRFEAELDNLIKRVNAPKFRFKQTEKVYEKLGRIKERYPSTHTHYKIKIETEGIFVKNISYKRLENNESKNEHGVYFIRTSIKENNLKTIWKIYNTLTEIEATFRTLKCELNIRPVYHQKDERTEAHIHLAILAYTLVNTIRYKLKQHKINYSWKQIIQLMNTQKYIVTTFNNDKSIMKMIKKTTKPIGKVLEIYAATNYNHKPMDIKKYVVPH